MQPLVKVTCSIQCGPNGKLSEIYPPQLGNFIKISSDSVYCITSTFLANSIFKLVLEWLIIELQLSISSFLTNLEK